MADLYDKQGESSEGGSQKAATAAVVAKREEQLCRLGPYLFNGFQCAAEHKRQSGIEAELLTCLRQCNGEYSPSEKEMFALRGVKNPVYMPHADLKRRTANSIVQEIFLNSSDTSWTLRPTPVPDLSDADTEAIAVKTIRDFIQWRTMELRERGVPQDRAEQMVMMTPPDPLVVREYAKARRDEVDAQVSEEAQRKSERMTKKMLDQMIEGKWRDAMLKNVDYASAYGTWILKGPIPRMRRRNRWKGTTQKIENVRVWEWEAVNPFDAYPAKGAIDINDGDFYQRVRFTPKDLNAMRNLGDGYYKDTIERILAQWPNGGLMLEQPADSERKTLENDGTSGGYKDTNIEGIEFWGDVRGSMLMEQGVMQTPDGKVVEEDQYYETNAIVINSEIVFCSITDERLGRPLFKGVFYRIPNSWWGESPMKKMRDAMRVYNSTTVDLTINSQMSATPMLIVKDRTRIPPGTNLKMRAGAILEFDDPMKRGDSPVDFRPVPSNAAEKIAIMERFEKLIDTLTGIPAYSHGSDTAAGAGRTYNGLLLIVNASKEGINTVVMSMFEDGMKPALTYLYRVNMLWDDDEGIKGDCEIDAGGLLSILVREQSINRLQDTLNLANNPNVMKIFGESGLSELLRQYVNLLQGINPNNVVPSKQEMDRRMRMAEIERQIEKMRNVALAVSQRSNQLGNPSVAAQALPVGSSVGQEGQPVNLPRAELASDMQTPEQEGARA